MTKPTTLSERANTEQAQKASPTPTGSKNLYTIDEC